MLYGYGIRSGVLVHCYIEKTVKITVDASPYGLGAFLAHTYEDGSERPVAYASRTLSPAEKHYSQLDKEALAIIFGIRKFHQYMYGRHFVLETDYKPLVHIFGSRKGLPQIAASRLQRWSDLLSGYDYDIKYIKGKNNFNADYLSRSPIDENMSKEVGDSEYTYLNYVVEAIYVISSDVIETETNNDAILTEVMFNLSSGPGGICNVLHYLQV